jgi:hypothetical protein
MISPLHLSSNKECIDGNERHATGFPRSGSVASTEDAKPRDLIEGVTGYGPDLVKLEPKHSPATEDQRRKVLEAERPFIEQFEYADTWGHALVRVRGAQVQAAVFRGVERKAWKDLALTAALV